MDSSRFKRREIQTRRQITNDFRGPINSGRADRSLHRNSSTLTLPGAIPTPQPAAQPVSSATIQVPTVNQNPSVSVSPMLTPTTSVHIARSQQPVMAVSNLAIKPVPSTMLPQQPVHLRTTTLPAIVPAVTTDNDHTDASASGLPSRALPISMNVPGAPSPGKLAGVKVLKSRWKAMRKWAFRSTAILLVLIIAGGGLVVSQGWLKARKVFRGGTTSAAALQANVNPQLLKGEGDGRINVLLLGRGGGMHDGPDLTDTMMVASIDPVNHTSTLLSIPRDMWVKVNGSGSMKINAAWETGKYKVLGKIAPNDVSPQGTLAGFTTVDQVVEGVIGVPIHYNVLVDFDAFKQAVDTVGGITVNVPSDLIDPTMAWENANNPVLAKAGIQNFDGTHALIYSRSRETSSDFARGQRQRAVLLALKEKVNTIGTLTNPAKLAQLANAFGSNVQTDLSLSDAAHFADIVKNIDNTNVNSIGLADAPNSYVTTSAVNGQSVVEPKAGDGNFTAIQTFVRSQLKDPYLMKEQAKIQVYNGTTVSGLAGSQADVLKGYGYSVTGTGNAPTRGYAQTVIVDLTSGVKKYTKHYLEQRYGVTAVTAVPDAAINANGADFVIIVGNDSTTTH